MNSKMNRIMLAVLTGTSVVFGDVFGTGTNQFTIDFETIANAGNAAQSSANRSHGFSAGDGYGSVAYQYRIGTFEVTVDQVAKAHNATGNIFDGDENPYGLSPNGAASRISVVEAARFANWLTSGHRHLGAYQLTEDGDLIGVDRASAVATYGTVYVIPTEDEWFKAAYFKSDGSGYTLHATGDAVPLAETDANYGGAGGTYASPWDVGSGLIENNGTYDMGGNVSEIFEGAFDGFLNETNESRGVRGGTFSTTGDAGLRSTQRTGVAVAADSATRGLRIAAIPEPSSVMLIIFSCGGLLLIRRWFSI